MHKPQFATTASALLAALLAGCATPPPQSAKNLAQPDVQSLQMMQEIAQAESRKLFAAQERLLKELRQTAAAKELQPAPPVYDPLEGKTISVAISKGNISQVLSAFSDAANVNLIVEPAVVQQSALTDMYLKNISLKEAFNEILKSYDVTGEIRNQTVRIKLYEEKFFTMDFLNISSQLALNSGGNVFGANTGGTGNAAVSGSMSMNTSAGARSDPYIEIENNIKAILGDGKDAAADLSTVQRNPQDPTQVKQRDQQPGFTLNKTSGTLFVRARPAQMRAVEQLVKRTQSMLSKQVYIEAQLIDVQLSDGYQFGIDWRLLRSNLAVNFGTQALGLGGGTASLPNGGGANPPTSITIPAGVLGTPSPGLASGGIAFRDNNGSAVVNALRSFGNLRVLSNPNIQVRNGTPAILSVGTSQRYVSRSSSAQNLVGAGASTTSSEVQTDAVFSGVMVGVLAMIREDGRIELLVNPVQSDVDPKSLNLVSVNDTNRVSLPQVAYKGLTTTLNVNDGDVVVIGGLIDQKTSGSNSGLPFLADVPLLGKLVSQEGNAGSSRELIIVLRVRLL